MRKIVFLCLCIIITNSCSYKKLTKSIKENQYMIMCDKENKKFSLLNKFRRNKNIIKTLDINVNSDTLFLVDSYLIYDETGETHLGSSMWTHRKVLSFDLSNGLKQFNEPNISQYKYDLITSWNLTQLGIESKNNWIVNGGYFVITRVVFKNKDTIIESHCFNDFFNGNEEYWK